MVTLIWDRAGGTIVLGPSQRAMQTAKKFLLGTPPYGRHRREAILYFRLDFPLMGRIPATGKKRTMFYFQGTLILHPHWTASAGIRHSGESRQAQERKSTRVEGGGRKLVKVESRTWRDWRDIRGGGVRSCLEKDIGKKRESRLEWIQFGQIRRCGWEISAQRIWNRAAGDALAARAQSR